MDDAIAIPPEIVAGEAWRLRDLTPAAESGIRGISLSRSLCYNCHVWPPGCPRSAPIAICIQFAGSSPRIDFGGPCS